MTQIIEADLCMEAAVESTLVFELPRQYQNFATKFRDCVVFNSARSFLRLDFLHRTFLTLCKETDLNLARTSLGTGPSPSDRETLEQIGSEVLRFIAAVERGEIPSDAVGLPPAPVGENVPGFLGGDWQGIAGLGGPQGGQGNVPASQAALDKLPRFTVKENSWVLHQTSLRLEGGLEKSFEALFAQFSSPPSQSVVGRLVLADPATGHTDLANASTLDRSIVVVDRGICTFASKALRAQAAGAAAVVVVQSGDVWPYVMEDSKGEANAGGLQIPVSMVSRDDGKKIGPRLAYEVLLSCHFRGWVES
ncbi:unnamed protein product [Discosporangium mesarthrocarpum]